MKINTVFAAFLFLGVTVATGHSQDAVETIKVGGVEVSIPLPGGFVRVDGVNPQYDEMQSGFIPASNRLLLVAGSEEARRSLESGIPADLERNLNVQVLRTLENKNVSESDFEELKEAVGKELGGSDISKELDKVTQQGTRKLNEAIGEKADVKITQTSPVGILGEDENTLSFGLEVDLGVSVVGESEKLSGYAGGCFLRLHGKVINLYVTSMANSPEDVAWVQDTMNSWKDSIFAANSGMAAEMGGVPESDLGSRGAFSGVLRTAVIGGAVGLLVGLIAFLFKRRTA